MVNFDSNLFKIRLLSNEFDLFLSKIFDIIPLVSVSWLNNDGIVIEWVGIIEVLVRYDWLSSPGWSGDWCLLNNNEIIVWIVVVEVGVAQVSSGGGWTDLSDGWVLNEDWEVVIWVVVIEVCV